MLPNPVEPLGPVIVKATIVVASGRSDMIEASDICELVTFPVITRSTTSPLIVVDSTVLAEGLGEGDGFADGVGVTVGALVGVAV
jgi:hypothetical protein